MAPAAHALARDALARLVRLLGAANPCVAEVAARVLARCCDSAEQVPTFSRVDRPDRQACLCARAAPSGVPPWDAEEDVASRAAPPRLLRHEAQCEPASN